MRCLAALAVLVAGCQGSWRATADGAADAAPDRPSTEPSPDGPPNDEGDRDPRAAAGARRLLDGPATLVGRRPGDAISGDGRHLAATLDRSGEHSLVLVAVESGEVRTLATKLGGDPADSAWDGDVLVVGSRRQSDSTAPFRGDIVLWRSEWTNAQRAVTRVGQSCDVSPDGQAVACVVAQDIDAQTYNLASAPVDGESETRVFLSKQYYDEARAYTLAWSPLATGYLVSGRGGPTEPERIAIYNGLSGERVAMVGDGSRPRVSPDGQRLVYLTNLAPASGGVLTGDLVTVSLSQPSASPALVASDVAQATFIDPTTVLVVTSPRAGRASLRLADLRETPKVLPLAEDVDGWAGFADDARRFAVVRGTELGIVGEDGQTVCQVRFSPPLGGPLVFGPDAHAAMFTEEAEVFLGAGAGRWLDLDRCTVTDLVPLVRWSIPMTNGFLLASTSNGHTGALWVAPKASAGAGAGTVAPLQSQVGMPFAYLASRREVFFTIDRGPDAGLWSLPVP